MRLKCINVNTTDPDPDPAPRVRIQNSNKNYNRFGRDYNTQEHATDPGGSPPWTRTSSLRFFQPDRARPDRTIEICSGHVQHANYFYVLSQIQFNCDNNTIYVRQFVSVFFYVRTLQFSGCCTANYNYVPDCSPARLCVTKIENI